MSISSFPIASYPIAGGQGVYSYANPITATIGGDKPVSSMFDFSYLNINQFRTPRPIENPVNQFFNPRKSVPLLK